MKTRNFSKVLVAMCVVSIMFAGALMAGTFRDDFDGADLSDAWVVNAAGNASYAVSGGQVTLTSSDVPEGINVCYGAALAGDVTCEVGFDTSNIIGDFAHFGFFDGLLEPMGNLDMHPRWVEVLYCNASKVGGVVNNGKPAAEWNRVVGAPEVDMEVGAHVFKIEVKDNHVSFFMDGELVGEADNDVSERYFILSADPYTTHYTGTFVVDYVELTGDSVALPTAVDSSGKLAATWGDLKVH